jgi:hypothetical protein
MLDRLTAGNERVTTRAVIDEIRDGVAGFPELQDVFDLAWLRVESADSLDELRLFAKYARRLGSDLHDIGEASVLAWARLEGEYESLRRREKVELSEDDRRQVLALARDLPRVWNAPTTTDAERKNLLRMLIRDVTLSPVDLPERATRIQVLWVTGATSEMHVPRPAKEDATRTSEEALAALRELFEQGLSDAEIAAELNPRGLPSGRGQRWVKGGVYWLGEGWRVLGEGWRVLDEEQLRAAPQTRRLSRKADSAPTGRRPLLRARRGRTAHDRRREGLRLGGAAAPGAPRRRKRQACLVPPRGAGHRAAARAARLASHPRPPLQRSSSTSEGRR